MEPAVGHGVAAPRGQVQGVGERVPGPLVEHLVALLVVAEALHQLVRGVAEGEDQQVHAGARQAARQHYGGGAPAHDPYSPHVSCQNHRQQHSCLHQKNDIGVEHISREQAVPRARMLSEITAVPGIPMPPAEQGRDWPDQLLVRNAAPFQPSRLATHLSGNSDRNSRSPHHRPELKRTEQREGKITGYSQAKIIKVHSGRTKSDLPEYHEKITDTEAQTLPHQLRGTTSLEADEPPESQASHKGHDEDHTAREKPGNVQGQS
mmetsp:Transcript_7812/g.17017  ORF Transcript_7812/g.17017 Transcript_7812/m.17017 type:complete len:263 (-) Transcript_7812:49-837(-)